MLKLRINPQDQSVTIWPEAAPPTTTSERETYARNMIEHLRRVLEHLAESNRKRAHELVYTQEHARAAGTIVDIIPPQVRGGRFQKLNGEPIPESVIQEQLTMTDRRAELTQLLLGILTQGKAIRLIQAEALDGPGIMIECHR